LIQSLAGDHVMSFPSEACRRARGMPPSQRK
jgi:hypothetical protein